MHLYYIKKTILDCILRHQNNQQLHAKLILTRGQMWAAWEPVSFQERCLTLIPSFILCRREAPISIASTWSHEPGTKKTLNILIYHLCSNEKLISGSVAQACQAFGTLNNQWGLGHSFKLVKSHIISPLNGFKYLVFTYVSVIMGGKFHYVNYKFTRSLEQICFICVKPPVSDICGLLSHFAP